MLKPTFSPGFRLSLLDVVVLVVGAITAALLAIFVWWLGFVVAFVLGHFFLFCNFIRMARPLELVWATVFVVLASATIAFEVPGWLMTASISLAVTTAVVLVEMRKPSYHGVGWQWINPELPNWWESRMVDTPPAGNT